jgi:type VI secretion system secreted protein Hcp
MAGTGDIFLMVKGASHGLIKGEAQDDKHKDEIEVLSWSWGMQAKPSLGGGSASGKATVHDLKIVKRVDSASTGLMGALRTNEVIQKAVLTVRKAGTKSQLEYLKVTIEQGRVTALTVDIVDNSAGQQGVPAVLERVSFSFNKIEVEYVPQGKDGLPKGGMTFADQWSEQQ